MIQVRHLQLNGYDIELDIDPTMKLGIYAQNPKQVKALLLMLAGMNTNNKKCLYQGKDLYDQESYFKTRIYMDCSFEYVQTLNETHIVQYIQNHFSKTIQLERLKGYFKQFVIRGECEITHRYQFSACGKTLLNMAIALSSDQHLILMNPTKSIRRSQDIEQIAYDIKTRQTAVILGLNCLSDFKNALSHILLLTDLGAKLCYPSMDKLMVMDAYEPFKTKALFTSFDQKRFITKPLSKEDIKLCEKQKIKTILIDVYDLEHYL